MTKCPTCRSTVPKDAEGWCPSCGGSFLSEDEGWELGTPPFERVPLLSSAEEADSAFADRRGRWIRWAAVSLGVVLIALAAVGVGSVGSGLAGEPELFPAYDSATGLFGYIDENSTMVVEPRFIDARPFSEGLAAVQPRARSGDYRWGYIDREGKLIIPAQFAQAGAFLPGGLALVKLDKAGREQAYIDKSGFVVYQWETPAE
jgi:hypothetical protein